MGAILKLEKLHNSSNYGISNIADSLHVSSPAISRTITALENKGYAVRYIDKLNRRNTNVKLTDLGVNLNLSNELLVNVEKEIKLRKNE